MPRTASYGVPRERNLALMLTIAQQALASGSPGTNPRVPTARKWGTFDVAVLIHPDVLKTAPRRIRTIGRRKWPRLTGPANPPEKGRAGEA